MKLTGKIIAVVAIIIAIYNFDRHNWNHIIVPILVIMSALMYLIKDSKDEFARRLNRFLMNASIALAVFLFLKILIYG
jgi:hypothetical protein